jgi:hypothetical protein
VAASLARKFGSALLTRAMSERHQIKFKSYASANGGMRFAFPPYGPICRRKPWGGIRTYQTHGSLGVCNWPSHLISLKTGRVRYLAS